MDDVLSRIEERLSMLRCNTQPDNVETIIECLGALTEEVRRLRTLMTETVDVVERWHIGPDGKPDYHDVVGATPSERSGTEGG
jgi:hypothetical protein